jgi:uncharacterized protein
MLMRTQYLREEFHPYTIFASNLMPHPLLLSQSHRLWPVPRLPWIMTQTWNKLLFAHWPVPPEQIRPLLPPGLTLDTFEGEAWVGVVPFDITDIRPRALPAIPTMSHFLELNVRTYVTHEGKPGVWFFSLDAASRLAVEGARLAFHLPYFNARMTLKTQGDTVRYVSERRDRRAGAGKFKASYRPVGEVFQSRAGTLEYFLTERYCLYSASRGRVYRANIHHLPWPLQLAEAEIEVNTVADAFGIKLPDRAPLLHYSERLPVLVWYLEGTS